MTILVGVNCKEGIVIGTDSIGTSAMGRSPLLQMQSNDKITIVGDRVIVAATGAVGLSQRLVHQISSAYGDRVFQKTTNDAVKEISRRAILDFQNTFVQTTPQGGLGFGALMAAPIGDRPCLVEFGSVDFQPEIKQGKIFAVSLGSGQVLADPFLAFISRVLWKNDIPDIEMGKFGVYWALDHTIKCAPGGVGAPIKMAVLKREGGHWKASMLPDAQEQAQYVADLERRIGDRVGAELLNGGTQPPPTPPIT